MNIAVIFAGGIGSRMNSGALPKQFLEIHGKPIIVHTIQQFQDHPEIDRIAVAILPDWRDRFARLVVRYELDKVQWTVDGGSTGAESRHRALRAVATDCPPEAVVLIHDGVRPLINSQLISQCIETVNSRGPAITCTKFNETIVVSSEDEVDDVIPRDQIFAAQAPQCLTLGDAIEVYERAEREGLDSIDTCTLLRRYDYTMYRVEGPRSNIKITTADDYYACRAYFDVLENRQIGF